MTDKLDSILQSLPSTERSDTVESNFTAVPVLNLAEQPEKTNHHGFELQKIINLARLKITDPIPENPVCLEVYQGEKIYKIGTLGNIVLIQARAKAGKTYLTSAIVASLISSKTYINFRGFLPSDKNVILYFDTEQGSEDARTVQERIYKMSGLDLDNECSNFQYYCLRRLTASQRTDVIQHLIYSIENIGCIIIDGVRDLINDFNDTGQSFLMINKLMKWTDEKQINIIAILHQNPNDEKARGHLGTELTNKAEFILSINKDRDEDSYRRIEGYGRRKSFIPFNYSLDENNFPVLSGDQKEAKKLDPFSFDLEVHRNLIDIIYKKAGPGTVYSLNGLWPLIKISFRKINKYYQFSDSDCRKLVHYYLQQKILKNLKDSEKMELVPYK